VEKEPKKAARKVPNPILHEIRGFTYTHTKKRFFDYRKPVFGIFCQLGGLFIRWAASSQLFLRPEITI
jgi:hypothetical protein